MNDIDNNIFDHLTGGILIRDTNAVIIAYNLFLDCAEVCVDTVSGINGPRPIGGHTNDVHNLMVHDKGIDTDFFGRPVTGDRMPGPFADLGRELATRSIDPRRIVKAERGPSSLNHHFEQEGSLGCVQTIAVVHRATVCIRRCRGSRLEYS